MTHAELRLQLLLALCMGHVDLPAEITHPHDLGDFLCELADRMAANVETMTAAEKDKP